MIRNAYKAYSDHMELSLETTSSGRMWTWVFFSPMISLLLTVLPTIKLVSNDQWTYAIPYAIVGLALTASVLVLRVRIVQRISNIRAHGQDKKRPKS